MERKSIYNILVVTVFVFLLILGMQLLFTPTNVDTIHESRVSGLIIQFRDGTSEQESKAILENYNLTIYKLDYNVSGMDKYYIIVDKDEATHVKNELRKEENWIGVTPDVEKENYYMISVSEQAVHDKNFIEMLDKFNLKLKKFFYCYATFTDSPGNGISKEKANELKSKLETNERIFNIFFESIES